MRELHFRVPEAYDGILLKSFLRGYCGLSARLMTRLKREPLGILRNGSHAIVTELLSSGDLVTLRMPDDEKQMEPLDFPLHILYEDCDVLAVDKPSDMPMYPSPGHDCDSLANAVAAYYKEKEEKTAFRPVYRLDKNTTGVVLLAKNAYAAAALAHKIQKKYTAICEGIIKISGTIELPIRRMEGHRIQRETHPDGEKAVTHYHVLSYGEGHSLVEFMLETGRTHQIRVHMSAIGHPLAGDDMYGGSQQKICRQALHCSHADFIHPVTKRLVSLESPLPKDMETLFRTFGLTF